MLHKFEKIVSIGRYRNYQAAGDVALKKLSLIYADNGSGKTTLTAILRSLTENKPDIIRRRISTHSSTPQSAQVIQRNGSNDTSHSFGSSGWSSPLLDIEILDIHFVHENIYSGFDFNDDQKKQLHQFVIGAQGVSIQQSIEKNKEDKSTSRQKQAQLEQQIIQQVGNDLSSSTIGAFLALSATAPPHIDQDILDAIAALANANSNALIQTLQPLSVLRGLNADINFPSLIEDLESTVQTLQDAALQALLDTHCEDLTANTIESPQTWLRSGFNYLDKKYSGSTESRPACPFCQQEVSDKIDIIKAYTNHFNDQFKLFAQRLERHMQGVQRFNLEAFLQALYNTNQSNAAQVLSWTSHLINAQAPVFNIIPDVAALRADFQELTETIQKKLQNPTVAVSTTIVKSIEQLFNIISTNIVSYNQSVTNYNGIITGFRATIKTVSQAQSDLNRLKRLKLRTAPAINLLCSQLVQEKATLKALELAYPALIQRQEAAAALFFSNYKDRINHYLGTVFKTPFLIDDVNHVPPQGKATQSKIGYKLTIDGKDISFDPTHQICAKDCLSEGDKNTIALAFFLSKLDIDQNIQNKILVFDDPLSSLDSNRRLYTVQLIKDLISRVKQIIVLSHNEFFLYDLSKNIGAGDKKTLRITENVTANASVIEPLVLEKLVENEYFKHVKELEYFLQHADINKKDTVLGWMRNVLEAHIRFKFYRQTSHLAPNSRTFGNLITALETNGVAFRDEPNRIPILAKLKVINGISCKPHHGEPLPDYGTLGVDPSVMNARELSHFVQDTLDLIDNKL